MARISLSDTLEHLVMKAQIREVTFVRNGERSIKYVIAKNIAEHENIDLMTINGRALADSVGNAMHGAWRRLEDDQGLKVYIHCPNGRIEYVTLDRNHDSRRAKPNDLQRLWTRKNRSYEAVRREIALKHPQMLRKLSAKQPPELPE